jgi:hypothetical protein
MKFIQLAMHYRLNGNIQNWFMATNPLIKTPMSAIDHPTQNPH